MEEKGALVDAARAAVDDLRAFCAERDVDLDALGRLKGFELVAAGRQTVEMLMADDDEKIAFLSRAALVDRLYKAILPDTRANEFSRVRAVSKFLADAIAAYTERADVSGVLGRVEQLLDESVAAQEYLIPDSEAEALFDLAAVDWQGLEEAFRQGRPRTAAQRLRSLLSARITALVRLNPVRVDLVERFEKLVADYNAGSINTETFFQELLEFSSDLTEEEARALSEGLTEEQLAIFDLLMRPAPELSDDEKSPGQEGGGRAAGHPQARQDRPGLAQGADDPRGGARRRGGDPGPAAGEVHPPDLRPEMRRRLPARLRLLLGRRALGLRQGRVSRGARAPGRWRSRSAPRARPGRRGLAR